MVLTIFNMFCKENMRFITMQLKANDFQILRAVFDNSSSDLYWHDYSETSHYTDLEQAFIDYFCTKCGNDFGTYIANEVYTNLCEKYENPKNGNINYLEPILHGFARAYRISIAA
jgi:hypothetical protein